MTKCNGCNTELVDGGVDWYCPNKECSYERDAAKAWLAKMKEQKEWEQYLRLKEKFEGMRKKNSGPKIFSKKTRSKNA